MPKLVVTVGGVEVRHVYLAKDRTTLGRGPSNDIVLQNPSVSNKHCVFELKWPDEVYLEDVGSTNGTFVNNTRVKRKLLEDDDMIAISNFRIRYHTMGKDSAFGNTEVMAAGPASKGGGPMHASFRVLSGSSAGLEVPVVKAVSTFGKPGVGVVAVSHRRNGYFCAHLEGEHTSLLNGKPLGPEPVQLANDDVLELAGTTMQFVLS